jgi:hypothetical protein
MEIGIANFFTSGLSSIEFIKERFDCKALQALLPTCTDCRGAGTCQQGGRIPIARPQD